MAKLFDLQVKPYIFLSIYLSTGSFNEYSRRRLRRHTDPSRGELMPEGHLPGGKYKYKALSVYLFGDNDLIIQGKDQVELANRRQKLLVG